MKCRRCLLGALVSACTVFAIVQVSAAQVEVDTASQRYIKEVLANPQVLYDTSLTWRSADRWLAHVSLHPWHAEEMYAELGFTKEGILRFEEVLQARMRLRRVRGRKDGIQYCAVKEGRDMDATERAEFESLEKQVGRLQDSLVYAKERLDQYLGPVRSERVDQWLREQSFLGAVVGTKVDQAFYGLVNFGPGYHNAPDSLESAWRLLEGSPSFQAMVRHASLRAYRTLPGVDQLSDADSAALMEMLQDYRRQVYRVWAELAVATETQSLWPGIETGSAEDELAAYTQKLVRRVRGLRNRMVDAAARAVDVSAEKLGETWLP